MAETINDLYLKYVNDVSGSLEQDRYFRYLYEMVQAGNNTLTQQRQILHKVVDERWLSTIEEALDALNRIVENPRRSIETKEEVVPVSLAKKITADSVRHLSMNTRYIANLENDNIQPTHILNVSVDETYNLYENRFIYHLIQRLVAFIDKRTDVIFWSTGDEIQNVLKIDSKVDDAYEQIDYSIEMKIKNLQSFSENDQDNMDVFMRIDRVRRLVTGLKNSAFCEVMAGCEKVRSPIQRTNLLVKDRDYRVCYQLWGFLESYDEVGYSIEVEEQAIQIDEEYLIQMYTNLITNYAVFKSVIEPDKREMEQVANTKRRVIKPKIVTEVIEQEVPDRNIPDVEIKKVFLEEVTQAQLDAEAKLEEETRLRKETEEALKNAEQSASHSMMRVEFALSEKNAALDAAEDEKKRRLELEEKLAQVVAEREEAYLQIQEKDNLLQEKELQLSTDTKDLLAQLEQQKDSYEVHIEDMVYNHENLIKDMQEDFKEQIENVEMKYFEQMNQREDELNQEYDSLKMKSEDAQAQAEENLQKQLKAQAEAYEKKLAGKDSYYEEIMNSQMERYESSLKKGEEAFASELAELKASYENQLGEQAKNYDIEIHSLKEKSAKEIAALKEEEKNRASKLVSEAKNKIEALRKQSEEIINENRRKSAEEIESIKKQSEERIVNAENEHKAAITRLEEEAKSRYDKLNNESTRAYDELKAQSDSKIVSLENKTKDIESELKNNLKSKESELMQAIELIRREKEVLEESNKKLEEQLKNITEAKQELEVRSSEAISKFDAEHKLRVDAESRMEAAISDKISAQKDVAILKAIQDQVRATSVSEFRKALKAEKQLRKKR